METINLGPFAIPIGPLLLLGAVLISTTVAKRMARDRFAELESLLWKVLIAGLLGARFAFVGAYFDGYKSAPWSILDIRDGGFSLPAGVIAAAAMALWSVWNRPQLRKPFALSVAAGAAVWTAGLLVMAGLHTEPVAMPQATLKRLDGGSVQLASLAGKPMVVNMWATWCPPCRREMPVLRDAQARYKDIVFVFANQGESAEAVRSYLDAEHLALENVLLDSTMQIGVQTGSKGLPTTLFFNEAGALVDRRVGELSTATLAQRIEALRKARQR